MSCGSFGKYTSFVSRHRAGTTRESASIRCVLTAIYENSGRVKDASVSVQLGSGPFCCGVPQRPPLQLYRFPNVFCSAMTACSEILQEAGRLIQVFAQRTYTRWSRHSQVKRKRRKLRTYHTARVRCCELGVDYHHGLLTLRRRMEI